MKKSIALILALVLLVTLAACGCAPAETTPTTQPAAAEVPATQAPTEAPTQPTEGSTEPPAPTEPEWESATVRAGYTGAAWAYFSAGTELKVIGQFQNFYVVELPEANLLVEKQLLRLAGEAAFESWNGYSAGNTQVFEDVYMRKPLATLNLNTPVQVLEGQGSWAYIQWDGGQGYVHAEDLSLWKYTTGSGSGGPADGTDVPIGSLTSATGSDAPGVHLLGEYFGPEMERFEGGMATVLADETEGYLCLLLRGDTVKVTEIVDGKAMLWITGEFYCRVDREMLCMEGDATYEPWTGYAAWDSKIFGECQMFTPLQTLSANQQITVIDELPGFYVVQLDGTVGYIPKNKVSQQPFTSSGSADSSTWTPPKK